MGIYRRQHRRSAFGNITAGGIATVAMLALSVVYHPRVGAFLIAAALHEAGHLALLRLFDTQGSFTVGLLGLRISYTSFALGTAKSCAVCAAGSVVGALAGLAVLLCPLSERTEWLGFSLASLTLSLVNLLPIRTLDGGALLELLAEHFMLPQHAAVLCRTVSLVFAVIFWMLGVYIYFTHGAELSLLLIGAYFIFVSILEP